MTNQPDPAKKENQLELITPQTINGVTVSRLGLALSVDVDEQTSIQMSEGLRSIEEFHSWGLADLARHVLDRGYSRALEHLAKMTKKSNKHLRALAGVSRAYPEFADRRGNLDFSHHQIVAVNYPGQKSANANRWRDFACTWLDRVEKYRWSCRDLKEAMKGTQKKERAERDLGFTPKSEIGWKLLSSLERTLINNVLKPTEVEFLQNVLFDLSEIKNIVENKITGAPSAPSHPSEESKTVSSSEACEAALDEYLAGARGQHQFNSVARKHNVQVKQLAHHRHQRAAVMKNTGASYSEIERTLGVKAEKLKKFMARHSKSVP